MRLNVSVWQFVSLDLVSFICFNDQAAMCLHCVSCSRCWRHHSSRHLLIWHLCSGGKTGTKNDKMPRVFNQEQFLTLLVGFSDGAFGNPWEWGVILHFSGGPQEFHTVAGEPISEGEMSRLCICTVFRSLLISHIMHLYVSRSVWPMFVFAGAYPEMPGAWSLQKAHSPRAALQPCSVRSAAAETSGCTLYCQPSA